MTSARNSNIRRSCITKQRKRYAIGYENGPSVQLEMLTDQHIIEQMFEYWPQMVRASGGCPGCRKTIEWFD